jgi:hypothetical protein
MINWLIWIVMGFLLMVGIIDFKFKASPSILLTGMIFAVAVLNPANLWFGIMGFIMAFLLYEGGFFSGVGDIKVMTLIALMLNTTNELFLFIILTLIFGFAWKGLWHWRLKAKRKKLPDEFPFLPVFLFVYIALYMLGVFA